MKLIFAEKVKTRKIGNNKMQKKMHKIEGERKKETKKNKEIRSKN